MKLTFSVQIDDLLSREVMRLRRILSPAPTGHPLSKEGLIGRACGAFYQIRARSAHLNC